MSRQTATQRDDKVLSVAKGIVERFRERGNVLPRQVNPQDRNTPAKVQEAKDAEKVKNWKKSFRKMPGQSYLPPCAKEYLDQHLTGWCNHSRSVESRDPPLSKAKLIVQRYIANGFEFPGRLKKLCQDRRRRVQSTPRAAGEQELPEGMEAVMRQAQQDQDKLRYWLGQEKAGAGSEGTAEALRWCDLNMPGRKRWRETDALLDQANNIFEAIVSARPADKDSSNSDDPPCATSISRIEFCQWYNAFIEEAQLKEKLVSCGSSALASSGSAGRAREDSERNSGAPAAKKCKLTPPAFPPDLSSHPPHTLAVFPPPKEPTAEV